MYHGEIILVFVSSNDHSLLGAKINATQCLANIADIPKLSHKRNKIVKPIK